MNFLGHIYLSGSSEEIQVGNFIGDYVKGKDYLKYPEKVKKGIILHRDIDNFTDKHPVFICSKNHLKRRYNKYSGIIVDIFYDHFLAKDRNYFSRQPLKKISYNLFKKLVRNYTILPSRVRKFLPLFIQNNWLHSYTTIEGIESVLSRMTIRTSLPD